MKIKLLSLGLIASMAFMSCKDDYEGYSKLGGSTDLPENEIGYTYELRGSVDGSVQIGSNFEATVIDKDGDIVEIQLEGDLTSSLISQIQSPYVRADGSINLKGKFINSTEGVAYVNAKGEQSILVKYDATVGDKWSYTTLGGKKLTREVISKSTEDDYFWGGMYIKVVEVEQNLPYPGFNKVVYSANHKFGLVGAVVTTEDGKTTYLSVR